MRNATPLKARTAKPAPAPALSETTAALVGPFNIGAAASRSGVSAKMVRHYSYCVNNVHDLVLGSSTGIVEGYV